MSQDHLPAPLGDDRDGDDVPDRTDACRDLPGMPRGEPSRNGCPRERNFGRDGDGIVDDLDWCPDVPGIPAAGDKHGCSNKGPHTCPEIEGRRCLGAREVIAPRIRFEPGSSSISAAGARELVEVVDLLEDDRSIRAVRVEGCAASGEIGAHELGLRRAEAVRAAIRRMGVEVELETASFGDSPDTRSERRDRPREDRRVG